MRQNPVLIYLLRNWFPVLVGLLLALLAWWLMLSKYLLWFGLAALLPSIVGTLMITNQHPDIGLGEAKDRLKALEEGGKHYNIWHLLVAGDVMGTILLISASHWLAP